MFVLPGDIQQHAHRGGGEQHACAAGAYERQGDAFCRHDDRHDGNIKRRLNGNRQHDPAGEELAEPILATHHHHDSQPDKQYEQHNHRHIPDEAQLFADDGEYEIRRVLWQVPVLADSSAETFAPHSAGAQGYLDNLPISKVSEFEEQLLKYVRDEHSETWQTLTDKGVMDDAMSGKLKEIIGRFKERFTGGAK